MGSFCNQCKSFDSLMAQRMEVYSMTSSSAMLDQESHFCKLERFEEGIYLLNFTGNSQNRLTPAVLLLIDEMLDQVLTDKSASVLITTNEGKFFSNGMDVNYLRKCDKKTAIDYVFMFQRLVSKLLTFSIPTIVVIRGHAVGTGCVFALAHDYRIMITTGAYIFLNEVDLGLPLTPGIMAVLSAKLPSSVFQEAVLTGKRYQGEEAVAAGFVQETYLDKPTLLQEGISKAMDYKSKNWRRDVYHHMKLEMYKTTARELESGGIGFARCDLPHLIPKPKL